MSLAGLLTFDYFTLLTQIAVIIVAAPKALAPGAMPLILCVSRGWMGEELHDCCARCDSVRGYRWSVLDG